MNRFANYNKYTKTGTYKNIREKTELKNFVKDTLKMLLLALVFSLVLVLLFALIVQGTGASDKIITPVNYAIKFLSLASAAILGISWKRYGVFKGAVAGALYIVFAFLIFAAMDGGFKDATFSFVDLICGTVAGGISGIIAVNIKKEVPKY